LDRDWEEIATQRDDNRPTKVPSDNLAYAIYTSGSAGKPKAVQVSHRSVVNCLYSIRQAVGFTENDTLLALTTISFDIAVLELFLPLLSGARIAFANRDEVLDGKQLANRLASSAATVMQGTPSTWRLLLNASWQGVEGFKILCGGEVLTRSLANDLLDGGASLWNLYGPTETTIWSTAAKIEPGEDPVLIGRPLGNTQIYILDSYLQPVPVGVHGELYIGGDGVARGYLNQPELTREKFVPDIFSDQTDARLYRTGDLARYRPDGNIEFLGRVDNQVKIRGHRIEVGEIEFVLNQHPAVKESVVIAHGRGPAEEKDLVSYIVPFQGSAISVSNLRTALSQKLPAFMIPSAFVVLDALPLTPNGKVDRSKLMPPDDSRPCLDQVCVEPRSEIEELVAQVWREALKLEKIGVFDNFFELGGHSLLATRVIARLRNNFNIDLPLRKLFELPTIAGLAEHVDFMRRNQSGTGIPPIVPVSRDRAVPLSFAQRRLWFLQKLDSKAPAYNIPATFRIKGPLNIVVLETALREIVYRHEVLRTRIIESDGEPFQQIVSSVTLTLPIIDISHWPEAEAEAEVNRFAAEDSRQFYSLEEAPLMRAKLLHLGKDDHVLILNFHHIVCDGSSLAIFYNELATVYQALLDDKPFTLPALRVQYADYAVWQQEGLKESLEPQLAYWKRQLGTRSTAANLPTDHNRPAMQTYNGARVTRLLTAELTTALKELSRKEGMTLFMTLFASLDIVLSRHTGKEDIVVGSTIAGRNRPEIDGLIGFFINALAMRVDLSGNPTFQDLLKRVREVCLDAYTHQDLPFDRVVDEINPERDLSRNPLFQIVFNMADVSQRILTLPGCKVTKVSAAGPTAKFDIVLHAPEINGSVELAMVYNADLFEESTITVLLDELSWLLSQVAEKPNSNIHEYSLLTPSAQAILPNAAEPLDSAWRGAIHTLVANQADRLPEQSAVIDADERWTYSELDSQSGQLANHLIESGIQPKDIVAIYAHRSGPLVLSLLGILKAGAAFTIIDPAYPVTRLLQYLRIARPKGWLQMMAAGELSHELDNFLDDPHLRCRISLPKSKPAIAGFLAEYSKIEPLGRTVSADDPAYVAFTSGSTGEPKGVLGRHRPITHFLPWQNETFDLRKSDRFCLLSGLGYNHLQRDVFTALALGTTLYIPAPDLMKSPERLIEWLDRREITILHLTPALARLLLTVAGKTLASVRRVFSGGDLLTSHDVSSIHELAPNAKIVSFYGATETQRAVGYFEIPEDISKSQCQPNRPIPLGRGAKDVQLLLLNPSGQLAGVGELSELYMRSPHLAHGYMADDDLTAHNFIKNPFTKDTADRLYRTGDLGRYLPDGNVEWAGRKDRRVSIRGFRVELAEIEATLNQHGAVTNSAVIARELIKAGEPTELRLFAYVESQQGQSLCAEELRCFLSGKLPSYMQPAHIVILDHLPLNPNGKVDFLKLSEPNLLLLSGHEEFEAPHSPIEKALAKIVTEVLGIERIGRQQNFFHLGGHSLLAAQVITRLKESLNVALDLRIFLETPTVEGLARQVEALQIAVETTQRARDIEREEVEM
jgi:amino acid adenylation domain-containing protein